MISGSTNKRIVYNVDTRRVEQVYEVKPDKEETEEDQVVIIDVEAIECDEDIKIVLENSDECFSVYDSKGRVKTIKSKKKTK